MLSTLLALALLGSSFVSASVQMPTLTSCSGNEKVKLKGISITDATIGQRMTLNFTLAISESLRSNPTLQVTMRRKRGNKIGCFSNVGSCTYKLCGGTTAIEQDLARPWRNRCPVPAMTAQESLAATLDPRIQFLIGSAPTTIGIELKVANGRTTVGCQSFQVNIAAANSRRKTG